MGKLVVGIFAVALLQFVFLGYLLVDGTRAHVIDDVTLPAKLDHEIARLDDIPEFDDPVVEIKGPPRNLRPRVTRFSRSKPVPPIERVFRNNVIISDFMPVTTVIQSGPGILSGYSMVLVDYSPDVVVNGKPKETRFR